MKVHILVKSIAAGRNKIMPKAYDYPPDIQNVEDLIRETVGICLHEFEERRNGVRNMPLEEQAASGKVVYGMYSERKPPDREEAVKNAAEAFWDGTVAIFVDGKKMETLTQEAGLREGSQVVFVKLTPLSASCMLLDWMC